MPVEETYTVAPHEWGPGKTHLLADSGMALRCRPNAALPPGERGDEPVDCRLCQRDPRPHARARRVPVGADAY